MRCFPGDDDEWIPDDFSCSQSTVPDVPSLMSILRYPDSNTPTALNGVWLVPSVGLRGSQGNDFWPDSNTPIAKEGMRMVPRRVKARRLTESLQGWTQLIHVGLRGFQGKGQKIIWYNLCCRMSGASMPAVLVAQCHGMCACT